MPVPVSDSETSLEPTANGQDVKGNTSLLVGLLHLSCPAVSR